jgi:hypothetical protein
MIWLSGENATASTVALCPDSVPRDRPSSTSHWQTVVSWLPEARLLLSGEKARQVIQSRIPVADQGIAILPGAQVPDADEFVFAAGCEKLAVRREGDRENAALVSLEFPHDFLLLDRPEPNEFFFAAGAEKLAIRTEGDRANAIVASGEATELPIGRDIEKLNSHRFAPTKQFHHREVFDGGDSGLTMLTLRTNCQAPATFSRCEAGC